MLALVACLTGCTSTPKPEVEGNLVTRVGFLAESVLQHPVILFSPPVEDHSGKIRVEKVEQFYFDLGQTPKSMRQIVVTYRPGSSVPAERCRKIELKGTSTIHSVGGKPGTKGEYKNEVLHLYSWKYLD